MKITNILIIIGEAEPVASGVLREAILSFTYPLLSTYKLNEKLITRGVSKGTLEDLTEKFCQ